MIRRVVRSLAERLFVAGYRMPRGSWIYALACGLESAWTVEGWRHDDREQAARYEGVTLARVAFLDAAAALRAHTAGWPK